MADSGSARQRLFVHFEQLLGPEDVVTLMDYLPPTPWADLATRADLQEVRSELRGELREARAETREEFRGLRGDVHRLEERLVEHVDLRVKASVGDSTRVLFFSMLASQMTLVGLVLAATKLG
jgi:hypothetical protein